MPFVMNEAPFPAAEVYEAMRVARMPQPAPGATLEVLPDARGAATALVVQDVFGGEIRKSSVGDGEWRFGNLIEGAAYDFAAESLDDASSYGEAATREEAFEACDFATYRILSQRFADEWELVESEDGRWQSCSSD